jgi:methylmalonyl-CoA mutase cobalamin-binding subunit
MKKILGACIGSCVHVAGIINFLDLSKKFGYAGDFIGSAVDIDDLAVSVKKEKPDIVAISYRLSPESFDPLMKELKEKIYEKNKGIRLILGTTKPVADKAKKYGIFDAIFTGEEKQEYVIGYLKNDFARQKEKRPPQKLVDRIAFQSHIRF